MRNSNSVKQRFPRRISGQLGLRRSDPKINKKLVSELGKLKKLLNLGPELEVEWRPGYVKYSSGKGQED